MLTTALALSLMNLTGIQFYIILINKEKAKVVTPEPTKSNKIKELCGPVPSGLIGSFQIKDPPLEVDFFTINTNLMQFGRVQNGLQIFFIFTKMTKTLIDD